MICTWYIKLHTYNIHTYAYAYIRIDTHILANQCRGWFLRCCCGSAWLHSAPLPSQMISIRDLSGVAVSKSSTDSRFVAPWTRTRIHHCKSVSVVIFEVLLWLRPSPDSMARRSLARSSRSGLRVGFSSAKVAQMADLLHPGLAFGPSSTCCARLCAKSGLWGGFPIAGKKVLCLPRGRGWRPWKGCFRDVVMTLVLDWADTYNTYDHFPEAGCLPLLRFL
jgi:hypothetical protein